MDRSRAVKSDKPNPSKFRTKSKTKTIYPADRSVSWMATKMYIVFIACLAVMVLSILWQHVRYTELAYELVKLERERVELLAEAKSLEVERELYRSPQRIARIATEELGLTEPNHASVEFIDRPIALIELERARAEGRPSFLERWSRLADQVTRLLVGVPPDEAAI